MTTFALVSTSAHTFVNVVARMFRPIRSAFTRYCVMLAEAHIHKARLEIEMYGNGYRLRTKTDDDLPAISEPATSRHTGVTP